MNGMRRRIGLFLAGVAAAAGLWACAATRNPDGSWNVEFAPDMTITAHGLEDALGKLTNLLAACLSGSYHRTCTGEELEAIDEALDKVLDRKGRMGEPRPPRPGGTIPC